MNDYLVDRETLGQFVDALIAQKYQNQPVENSETLRETLIEKIDDRILDAIFRDLSKQQLAEINVLFDRDEEDPAVFEDFFKNANINIRQKTAEALESFKAEFLGGNNA